MPDDKLQLLFEKIAEISSDVKVIKSRLENKVTQVDCEKHRAHIYKDCSEHREKETKQITEVDSKVNKVFWSFTAVITFLTIFFSVAGFAMKVWK